MKVLFIGDVIGRPGRKALRALLPALVGRTGADFVIANGENAAGGFGINEKTALEIFSSGVDLITGGNHIWDNKDGVPYIMKEDRVLRPLNFPPGSPGHGSIVNTLADGRKIAVLNLSGRVFMPNNDCPFRTGREEIEKLRETTKNIIVDLHAEATSEKEAFGYFVDGTVSAVIGTHTHVQTADEKILPKGTAYITDVGMTGPTESVIGMDKDIIIEKFLTQMPRRFEVAGGPSALSAVLLDLDSETGLSVSIERLSLAHG